MSSASTDKPADLSAAPGATVADRSGSDVLGAGERSDRRWTQPVWAAPSPDDGAPRATDDSTPPERPAPHRRRALWAAAGGVAVGILALVAVAEIWGRGYVADQVEEQLRASGIDGDIIVSTASGWRPDVVTALAGMGLDELRITITDGSIAGMPVARADYVLKGIDGDVSLRTGEVQVRSIETGRVRIEVAVAEIASATGAELEVGDGRLVTTDGMGVDLSVEGDTLVLGGPAVRVWGAPMELPILDDYLMPCTPLVAYRPETLVLYCSGARLPGVLREPLAVNDDPDVAPVGSLLPPQSTIVREDPSASTPEAPTTAPATAPVPTEPVPTEPVPTEPVPVPG